MTLRTYILAAVALSLPMGVQAQEKDNTGQAVGRVASQPVRDVGLSKKKIPPVLAAATENPYSLNQTQSCPQIAAAIRALNGPLGADFGSGSAANARKSNVIEIGAGAVVNSLIPFRGVVREVSGAAPAERRYNTAVFAGLARRGFLRGLQVGRRCKAS